MAESWSDWGRAVDDWYAGLAELAWGELAGDDPGRVAVCVVDMLEGFARVGPLASPRVARLGPPVRRLVEEAARRGARIVACQDCHHPGSREFAAYPAHCLRGSEEAQPMAELAELPAYRTARLVEKNSLSALLAGDWHEALYADGVRAFVVCGDCTDLCVTYLAMPLRLWANQGDRDMRVVVPADAVDTFDLPGHPAEPVHRAFLHHMAQNGVEVVRTLRFD
ncbi:MAG: cysteine hydrolase [Clostridia bacterium]|nr:cysteine hydrolase [Clostridia bacterium]